MKKDVVAKLLVVLLVVIAVADALGAYSAYQSATAKSSQAPVTSPTPKPSPTLLTPSIVGTTSPTASPTSAATAVPTAVPTPTSTPTSSATPASTSTPVSTPTPTLSPSPTPVPTPTPIQALNWAGYVVASNSSDLQSPQPTVTNVSASWVVPAVQSSTLNTYSAVWIGIGGQFDSTLIQCGTEQDYSISGGAVCYAWYELLPASAVRITNITVSQGDQMQASIQLTNATSDQWTINITDLTSSQSYQGNVVYNSSRLSAEWIVERPSEDTPRGTQMLPLANFGNVTLTNCTASFNSTTGTISNFPYQQIIMYSSGPFSIQLTDVSDLTPDGSSFTVTYVTSG